LPTSLSIQPGVRVACGPAVLRDRFRKSPARASCA
jgi:hypothetical protein